MLNRNLRYLVTSCLATGHQNDLLYREQKSLLVLRKTMISKDSPGQPHKCKIQKHHHLLWAKDLLHGAAVHLHVCVGGGVTPNADCPRRDEPLKTGLKKLQSSGTVQKQLLINLALRTPTPERCSWTHAVCHTHIKDVLGLV